MKKQTSILLVGVLLGFISSINYAMVFDNRFMPLLQRPYIVVLDAPSHFRLEGFFARATQAYDNHGEEIPLPLLFGPFDQAQWAQSFVAAGKANPLAEHPSLILAQIPWNIEGKLQAQGFALAYQQRLVSWLSVGFYTMIMRVNSRQSYFLNEPDTNIVLNSNEQSELDRIRRSMFKELNLTCGHSDQFGPGDLEVYLRWGHCWDYAYKFRHIDMGVRVGALVATGVRRDINQPTSIPFGGNGHHGMYASVTTIFEVKEDLFCGMFLRVSKRFARTQLHRMPRGNEPSIFGVVTGNADVNPGATIVFSPYVYAENLREGFGAGVRYLLTNHWDDVWCDVRLLSEKESCPVNLKDVQKLSGWGSDYISLTAFYDFGKIKIDRSFRPIFSVTWDVPTSWFIAHNSATTNRVTIGIDFNF